MPNERRNPGPPPRSAPLLDDVDRIIVAELTANGRASNAALAEAAGIAPSTCHARVRSLQDRGILGGFHAAMNLAALGYALQALVAVRLTTHSRAAITDFHSAIADLPGVLSAFHVSGANDYLLHVAAADSDALREFVLAHVTAQPAVAHVETSIIFEHIRGPGVP
jgi:DNA-binding Lrp family transcriptional regulator